MRRGFWGAVWLLASTGAAAADCNRPAAIQVAPGAGAASVASSDPVPTIECYQVAAQADQELSVYLDDGSGPELEVFAPGWSASCDPSGACDVSGDIMSEPGETDWSETLTQAGAYLIVIDNPRGDEYRLTVEIREAKGGNAQ